MSDDNTDACCEIASRLVKKMRAVKEHQQKFKNVDNPPMAVFADKSMQVAKLTDMFWHYISHVEPGSDQQGVETLQAFENLLDPVLNEILSAPLPSAA